MAAAKHDWDRRRVAAAVDESGWPEDGWRPIAAGGGRPAAFMPMTRRTALSVMALSFTTLLSPGCAPGSDAAAGEGLRSPDDSANRNDSETDYGGTMRIHYLEVVTTDVDPVCALYSRLHGVTFGDADPSLGGARTTRLANGGMVGVRAPLNEGERVVVRPYALVEDIEAAVAAAVESGASLTLPPMELPGHGTCAIVYQGGIECGLWQL